MMTGTSDFDNNMEPLISSLHSLVDRNHEMQTKSKKFHRKRNNCETSPSCEQSDAIPKDSFGLNRYNKYFRSSSVDDENSDADSTAAESSSWCGDASSSGSSATSYLERPRRVRFDMCVYFFSSSDQDDAENDQEPIDRDALWYNAEDFRHFRKYSKKLASMALASPYGQELEQVLEICTKATNQDVTHCSRIANSAARGLEVVVSEVLISHRRAAIQAVLQAQQDYKIQMMTQQQRGCYNAAALEQELCDTSKSLTRTARLFARILGNGDAAVAKAMSRQL